MGEGMRRMLLATRRGVNGTTYGFGPVTLNDPRRRGEYATQFHTGLRSAFISSSSLSTTCCISACVGGSLTVRPRLLIAGFTAVPERSPQGEATASSPRGEA